METRQNIVERAYIKLNDATKLTVTLDEWFALVASGLAVAMPHMTGVPSKYASPLTLFVMFSAFAIFRRRATWVKNIAFSAIGCFVFYLILAVFGSKQ